KPLAGLLPQQAMTELFATVMQTGRQHAAEYSLEGGRILLLQAAPLHRPGETWGAVGILQDVTEIRRMEQLRRDFVANVSHELRTPMTSIQGFVEALLDGLAEDKASRLHYLQIILAETVRLNRLITDLLDLSRLEMQQIPLPLEAVDLASLIRDVTAKLQPQVEKNGLTLKVNLPERLQPVTGNYDRLQQVLINLCSNAIAFTPPGGRITVTAREIGELVRVSVSDTGPGIPVEEQDKIWQRFHRVDKARSRSLGGTGLGLAIVKQIIEAHGGSVGLTSMPGEGATFSFTLKIADNAAG
ncbi:MAG TPA: PAS domain-containing sensor histidine kinase, partial [Firmicutes bacterium]|nr:PAS domain-containing sensor histidine kinase [Bacillota bacterium]